MVFDLLRKQRGLARHVLFDSWFSEPIVFKTLYEMGFHGLGMLPAKKTLYRYKGKMYNLTALYALAKPFLHREQGFATIGVELRNGIPMSITFIRDSASKRNWLAIGTTDLSLSPKQVISLYSRRWNIEVFFKTVKSCLGFAKECQSRSFDAIVCSVSVVFTRHMILTWVNLGLPVPETDGQLFFRLFDELRECTFIEALDIVMRELAIRLVDSDNLLDMSVRDFIASIPSAFNILKTAA
ncbi:MAG: transposase [Oscillospiraceae bacterium]|nr:transposase [Oscillospiraceae bacterium]